MRDTVNVDGNAIVKWRRAKVLTQQQVAQQAGITPATLCRIERGQRARIATVQAIAEALEVQPSLLVADTR